MESYAGVPLPKGSRADSLVADMQRDIVLAYRYILGAVTNRPALPERSSSLTYARLKMFLCMFIGREIFASLPGGFDTHSHYV